MRASIDGSRLNVNVEESSWPFRLNLLEGSASIELDDCVYEIRPLTWRAKMRLARFAHLGAEFIQSRFLEASLGTSKIYPAKESTEAALVALAMWINLPSEQIPGLPLDQSELAIVTLELCRSLGVGPMAFSELTAAEVETLWQNMDRRSAENDVAIGTRPIQSAYPTRTIEQQGFDTRIVIVPDEGNLPAEAPRRASDKTPAGPDDVVEHRSAQQMVEPEPPASTERVGKESKTAVSNQLGRTPSAARKKSARFRVSFDNAEVTESNGRTATLPKSVRQPQRAAGFRAQQTAPAMTAFEQTNRTDCAQAEAGNTDGSHVSSIAEHSNVFPGTGNSEASSIAEHSNVFPGTRHSDVSSIAEHSNLFPGTRDSNVFSRTRWTAALPVSDRPNVVSSTKDGLLASGEAPNGAPRIEAPAVSRIGASNVLSSVEAPGVLYGTDRSQLLPSTGRSSLWTGKESSSELDTPETISAPGQAGSERVARPAYLRWPEFETGLGGAATRPEEEMELMLDEFCERLAEAAADLGLMGEI